MARRATNHEDFPERDDVQWMKHILLRLDAKHLETALVMLENQEVIRSVLNMRLQLSCNSSVTSKVRPSGVAQFEVILHNGPSPVMVFAEMKRDGMMKEVEELPVVTQEVLDQHKLYRRMRGVSSFEWNTAIEATAQSWADQKHEGITRRVVGVTVFSRWNRARGLRLTSVACAKLEQGRGTFPWSG